MKILRYDNRILENAIVTKKLDGIQCMFDEGRAVSRKGKPLYGIDPAWLVPGHIYEVFCGDFRSTVVATRTRNAPLIDRKCLYTIWPVDHRIMLGYENRLSPAVVQDYMDKVLSQGHEGLVIRTLSGLWKVKPVNSYDVRITGLKPGKNRHKGRLGAFETARGLVGTGLTDLQREKFNRVSMVGEIIEVQCMELTPGGKFRHPRFIRHRFDKSTESDQ